KYLSSGPDDPVVIFNGDVLTGLDISGLISKWRESNADVALYLTRVSDPRAYGLVPTDESGRVLEFLEKPTTPEEIVTDQINAGCYVFKRSVIDSIPADRVVSVERETFPELLANKAKVIGVVDSGYWLDLGTPLAFAKGSADLVQGIAPSPLLAGVTGESFVSGSATVSKDAKLVNGTYIGPDVQIGQGSIIDASVIFPGVIIGERTQIRNSIISSSAQVFDEALITDSVVAESAIIGGRSTLEPGARIFPGEQVAEGTTVPAWSD
ncbi:MAG: NDP-sugar synthase, partial [Actinomycetales bacterium]|nr:NDP-sugar synthase [Actinomycetales bacterium]